MIGFCDLLLAALPAGRSVFADIMQIKQNATAPPIWCVTLVLLSRQQTLQPLRLNITACCRAVLICCAG